MKIWAGLLAFTLAQDGETVDPATPPPAILDTTTDSPDTTTMIQEPDNFTTTQGPSTTTISVPETTEDPAGTTTEDPAGTTTDAPAGTTTPGVAFAAIECPNNGYDVSSDGSTCVPVGVGITCNPTNMVVSFTANHIYVNMDDSHHDMETSAAFIGDCTELSQSVDGLYELTVPLDGCGTTVSQSEGVLTFTNTIFGSEGALMIDNIITTETLQLGVQCDYSDSFDLLVSDIGVDAAGHTLDSFDATGEMNTEFSLTSYIDAAFSLVSDATTNTVIIGEPVYNRVEVSGSIPTNVDYVVKQCTAMDAVNSEDSPATIFYDVFKNGCLDNLVETQEISDNFRGTHETTVDFKFNGFTFESSSDTLFLECSIVLCALDADGNFQDASCGFDDSDLATTCDADGENKALGLSVASVLSVPALTGAP